MKKFDSGFQKILIIASFGMILAMAIIASISVNYIKNEITTIKAQSQRFPDQPADEILKPGTVGETKNTDSGQGADAAAQNYLVPPVIFNTTGTILEVKSDRLVVRGDGSNFVDGNMRNLNAFFTMQTIVFVKGNQEVLRYEGFEGLKYLKATDNILIEGEENLRGKTQFKVKTINIL